MARVRGEKIQVQVDPGLATALRAEAARRGLSLSSYVRWLILHARRLVRPPA